MWFSVLSGWLSVGVQVAMAVFLVWADAPLFALAWIAVAVITARATLDDERKAAESEEWDWP